MKLADNMDRHKISDEFEFPPDRTIDFGNTCPLGPKTFIFDLIWRTIDFGVTCPLVQKNIFDLVRSIACLVLIDKHKISDVFEFRQDQTIHFGVTCH